MKNRMILIVILLVGILGYGIGSGAIFGSKYDITYKEVKNVQGSPLNGYEMTINGPAADLEALLVNPKKDLEGIEHVSSDYMMSGTYKCTMTMNRPQTGKWTLMVRRAGSKQVVWQQEVEPSPVMIAKYL